MSRVRWFQVITQRWRHPSEKVAKAQCGRRSLEARWKGHYARGSCEERRRLKTFRSVGWWLEGQRMTNDELEMVMR